MTKKKVEKEEPKSLTEQKKAYTVFGLKKHKELDFNVPVFCERTELVPEIDENYQFRQEYLVPVLWALLHNKKAWLSGHTGTGKSTFIAQVAARLNYELVRVNFDSEISRMDLVGRDVLKKDKDGVTVSEFVDGILPRAMQRPCIMLCDEVDFVRPDVSYVFQRALEDEGLLISEDGGRLVKPNEHFRIFATANTQGQGDETGIYQGARAQSMAFLDRFTIWLNFDYLPESQERELINKVVPDLPERLLSQLMAYIREHRQAFGDLTIIQPLSPRTVIALAETSVFFDKVSSNPLADAAIPTLLNRANETDRSVIVGIVDRVAEEKAKPTEIKKADSSKPSVTDSTATEFLDKYMTLKELDKRVSTEGVGALTGDFA